MPNSLQNKNKIPAFKELKPIVLPERGKVKYLKVYSVCADSEHIHFHKNLVEKLKGLYPTLLAGEEIDFIDKTYQKSKRAKYRATYVVVESELGSVQKVESFWDPKKKYGDGIETEKILKELAKIIENDQVAIDEHHSDQLLIFMALAKGESVITVKELSLHFQTICHILPIFLKDVKISITAKEPSYHEVRVKGINYQP